MNETVKELLRAWRSAGWKASPKEAELFNGLGIATEGVLLQLGILDARIIRGTSADAPVWVIAPKAWERLCDVAAKRANAYACGHTHYSCFDPDIQDDVALYLQALLPGARRVKEVVTLDDDHGGWTDGGTKFGLLAGDTIAILHNEQEKE